MPVAGCSARGESPVAYRQASRLPVVQGWDPAADGKDRPNRLAALWQQFKRVSVTWPDDGEVAAVERGDPERAMPLGCRRKLNTGSDPYFGLLREF